jgi:hypothetical protein
MMTDRIHTYYAWDRQDDSEETYMQSNDTDRMADRRHLLRGTRQTGDIYFES